MKTHEFKTKAGITYLSSFGCNDKEKGAYAPFFVACCIWLLSPLGWVCLTVTLYQ